LHQPSQAGGCLPSCRYEPLPQTSPWPPSCAQSLCRPGLPPHTSPQAPRPGPDTAEAEGNEHPADGREQQPKAG